MSNTAPDYGMPIPSAYIANDNEKTFQNEDSLPSLPLPDLEETLKKYLDSVRPHLTDEEYLRTKGIVERFGQGIGKDLHKILLEKSQREKNWIELWWEEYAYLKTRTPHAPYLNTGASMPFSWEIWPPKIGSQTERMGLVAWCALKFWELLRKEKIRVNRNSKGEPFSMYQFSRMFNGCKTPGEHCDKLNDYFKTDSMGRAPSHILVICRGRYFVFDVLDSNGHLITAPEIQLQLDRVKNLSDSETDSLPVGVLTAQDRNIWHQTFNHIWNMHREHRHHIELIKKSIFAISLDDACPRNHSEAMLESLIGNSKNRWFDKSLTFTAFQNGILGENCDHSPYEGMISVIMNDFIRNVLEGCRYTWQGPKTPREGTFPKEMIFQFDTKLLKAVDDAEFFYKNAKDLVDLRVEVFDSYGKDLLRRHKLHPDAFVQVALQLAYYRLHKKFAPTYETATVRRFYHGRTETIRSCTMESVEFAKSMLDPSSNHQERLRLFHAAHSKHIRNMEDATENRGCDRHLFGLYILALERGIPIPEIFLDEAYTKSGGGGNYILSTSFIGYVPAFGSVVPMCKNGYGCFYSIFSKSINVTVVCWKADQETSVSDLYRSLSRSLIDMKDLFESAPESKL